MTVNITDDLGTLVTQHVFTKTSTHNIYTDFTDEVSAKTLTIENVSNNIELLIQFGPKRSARTLIQGLNF